MAFKFIWYKVQQQQILIIIIIIGITNFVLVIIRWHYTELMLRINKLSNLL